MTDKRKVKLYVMAAKYEFSEKYVHLISETNCLSANTGDTHIVLLSEVDLEIDVPDLNEKQLKLLRVGALEEQIQKEKADSHVRVIAIEEKIQSLMCIENQSDKVGG